VEYIGIDVHKRESQVCILDDGGAVMEERRIRSERSRFASVFRTRPRARIVLEASTESEWVAQCVEELGHEVIVADPNYAPMYATRSRRVKTDRRDARTLAEAGRLGAYRPAHRMSAARREVRAALAARDALVRTRVRYISLIRALLRREGIAVASGSSGAFLRRLEAITLPVALQAALAPLVTVLAPLDVAIAAADARITETMERDAVAVRLCTVPGVGPVTATAFVATLDEVARFRGAPQVAAYLGLVPQERSSGDRQHRGGLTKAGNARARWVLVQAAWAIWRDRTPRTAKLRTWVERIAMRRGKRVAAVALARRLAGILYALWRDGTIYDPQRVGRRPAVHQVAA
jgi:transposase